MPIIDEERWREREMVSVQRRWWSDNDHIYQLHRYSHVCTIQQSLSCVHIQWVSHISDLFMYHGNILRFLQVHAWSYDTQSKCLMNIWEKTDFFAFKWFSVSLAPKNDFFSAAVSVLFRFVLSIKWPFFESKSYYTQFYTVSWSHFKHTHFTCSSVLLLLLVINFSLAGFLPSLYLCRISEFGFGSNSKSNSNDSVER